MAAHVFASLEDVKQALEKVKSAEFRTRYPLNILRFLCSHNPAIVDGRQICLLNHAAFLQAERPVGAKPTDKTFSNSYIMDLNAALRAVIRGDQRLVLAPSGQGAHVAVWVQKDTRRVDNISAFHSEKPHDHNVLRVKDHRYMASQKYRRTSLVATIAYIYGLEDGVALGAGMTAPSRHPTPDEIHFAVCKLRKEPCSYWYIAERGMMVGYASLWRVPRGAGEAVAWKAHDNSGHVSSDGPFIFDKSEGEFDGYISALRLVERLRRVHARTQLPHGQLKLIDAVAEMLLHYAMERKQYCRDLFVHASHAQEQDYFSGLAQQASDVCDVLSDSLFRIRLMPWELPDTVQEKSRWNDLAVCYLQLPAPSKSP